MRTRMHLVCMAGLFLALVALGGCLRLGAFNIQSFGKKKACDPDLMDIISTIIRRYDIILIQEVRDNDLSATNKLMEYVNKGPNRYQHIVSKPLGHSTYKERYLYLYREDLVSVVDKYTYDDRSETFSREPFVVMFSSKHTAVKNFVLIPQHTSPKSAVEEVDALYDVAADVQKRWKTNDIILLGDFNAGCSYVKLSDQKKIRLFTDKSYHWLIGDDVDTTVSNSNCPYDRIVATKDMMRGLDPDSAKVFNYMKELHLTDKQAFEVSDHYPVEVDMI